MRGNNNKWQTIMVTPKLKRRLDALKVHPNQAYHDVINKLLDEKEAKHE